MDTTAPDPRLQYLQTHVQAEFRPLQLEIRDDGARHAGHAHAGRGHYSMRIVAAAFAGKDRLQRHRMVYAALGDLQQADIHALSIQALAPDECH
ncbi:MAG: BolA family transcriptional regulator [Gammaproteobacteria bacterium]|nr:BolA family transcriptional regulator [Gammaproteobacteria bacterium]